LFFGDVGDVGECWVIGNFRLAIFEFILVGAVVVSIGLFCNYLSFGGHRAADGR